MLHGDPGVGKTTLLDALRHYADSSGFEVLASRGSPTDAELGFAALLTLLRPIEGRLDELAGEFHDDLRAALALGSRREADDVAVRLGVYRAVTNLAESHPVLLVVDDAPHVDAATATVLAFLLGRLTTDPIVAVVATDAALPPPLDTVDHHTLSLGGLPDQVVAGLLEREGPIADEVALRCAALAGGNPLVALEVARGLDPDERAGTAPLPAVPRPPAALARGFAAQLDALDEKARRALVVVAADDTGRLDVVQRALERLGEDPEALDSGEAAGLVRIESGSIRLAQPLLRAVAYHQVAARSRRAAHRALAAALDRPEDAAARAWQLAAAADGTDEIAAEALQLVAIDVGRRGGPASAARVLERAAVLSPDDGDRNARRLAAAERWLEAWEPDRARDLLPVSRGPLPDDQVAQLADILLRTDGPDAARRQLAGLDGDEPTPWAGAVVADLTLEAEGDEAAIAVLGRTSASDDDDPLADVLANIVGARAGRTALGPRPDPGTPSPRAAYVARRWVAAEAEGGRLDPDEASVPAGLELPLARALLLRHAGLLARADEVLAVEAALIPEHAGLARAELELALADLAQLRGRTADALDHLRASDEVAAERRGATGRALHAWVEGRLRWAAGELDRAAERLEVAAGLRPVLYAGDLAVVLAALGRPTEASAWAAGPGEVDHPLGGARAKRAAAAVRGDDDLFRQAHVDALAAGLVIEAAETALARAEALVRAGQPSPARDLAREAGAALAQLGAAGWQPRVSRIADAAESTAPSVEAELTAAEFRVASAVAEGGTNKEVAAKLFLSVKTVDFHLQNIYRKLGLRSRTELAVRLSRDPQPRDEGQSLP